MIQVSQFDQTIKLGIVEPQQEKLICRHSPPNNDRKRMDVCFLSLFGGVFYASCFFGEGVGCAWHFLYGWDADTESPHIPADACLTGCYGGWNGRSCPMSKDALV